MLCPVHQRPTWGQNGQKVHQAGEQTCDLAVKLTASTACWRMDVNLENILFFDWTSFSREDRENSSIFFFLLLPPRSRLEVSCTDPCNERIKEGNKTATRCYLAGPHGPGATTVNKALLSRVTLTLDTVALRSPRRYSCLPLGGAKAQGNGPVPVENDRRIQMCTLCIH